MYASFRQCGKDLGPLRVCSFSFRQEFSLNLLDYL
jgi:hypothetical protein